MRFFLAAIFLLLAETAVAAQAQTVPNILTWTDTNAAPANETQTLIMRGVQGQGKVQIAIVNPDLTTYTDNFPIPATSTTVCYQVVAAIGGVTSQPSNEACKGIGVPKPITNLTVQ